MLLPLQLEVAGTKLLDYGVLGIVLFFVGYFAYKLYMQQQGYTQEWKLEAKESHKAFVELSAKQNSISEKQIEIQEKQTLQTKDFYDSIIKRVDELPSLTLREIEYNRLQDKQNNPNVTPAP